ncbi:effector binding domain-containing protein [Sedimentibacter sp.]|uniref:effector binding domain-containing protein n=1 Tax=Sedimentibacter sp. TaxID=1960295 RepID=UPI0028A5B552|nr:effector binding domain-containing protein [Sedimentibacter sp.]
MQRIGEVSAMYDISNRTLHYWEESGILKSCRMENGYRYYDDYNIARIKQIIMLRKLKLPIQGIHRIFASGELSVAIEVLTNHLEQTNHKADELRALSIVLERLIQVVKDQGDPNQIFKYLDVPENSAILKLKDALQIALSERDGDMSESYSNNDVRIVNLPRMTFASYAVVSDTPENDCWEKIYGLIVEYSLEQKPGFRHFGFGFNNSNGEYGYGILVVVPENFKVPEPFIRKEFDGGLFAALPTHLTIIGERWDQLNEWLRGNEDYELDWHPEILRDYLEECIDYKTFSSKETEDSKKQLDLLLPIKRISESEGEKDHSIQEVFLELEPKKVLLPDITLGGCLYELKDKKLPWKKSVPWYKLAQAIYKSGKDFGSRMIAGNNTFTLVFGETALPFPFYSAGKDGFANKVFAAVEIVKSFESYPDGLEERVLPSGKYLLFSTWICPERVTTKKLPLQKLYNAAAEYIRENNIEADMEYCLEREYRKDGRNTDRIELYIPFNNGKRPY